jgi:catechol 2,3-dioxygenase-like lactoylglutathione lyase family enzyme
MTVKCAVRKAISPGDPLHMILHLDHVTVVVQDVTKAKAFFALLGFVEDKSVVISGTTFARYMDVKGIEAEHITLVSKQATPRFEIQLLRYIRPQHLAEANVENLAKLGYNHICFAVTDLDAEVKRLTAEGVTLRSDILEFHARKLVFLSGPEGITVELAEWHR